MAENIGKVVQVIGPTVDCEFDSDQLPKMLNALKIEDKARSIDLTVEVANHRSDSVNPKRSRPARSRFTTLRCSTSTPLGVPVLPEVNRT